MIFRMTLFAALAIAGIVHPAYAEWPERPIKMIVPFSAGSSSDIIARVVAAKMGTARLEFLV